MRRLTRTAVALAVSAASTAVAEDDASRARRILRALEEVAGR